MNFLPMIVEEYIETYVDTYTVEGVMTRDFGPWNTGERHTLTFNFEDGCVTEYEENGTIIHSVNMTLNARR